MNLDAKGWRGVDLTDLGIWLMLQRQPWVPEPIEGGLDDRVYLLGGR